MDSALDEALLLKRNPDRLFFQQQLPLPNGIAHLIRIAIDPDSISIADAQRQGLDNQQIKDAAAAYLKGVCLFPGSQGLRVLGLNDASDNKIMLEHRRLLLKWLHPDRNPENRHLAERVNRAWALQKAGQIETIIAQKSNDFVPAEAIMAATPRRSRFPAFLLGISLMGGVLWMFSRIPDSTEYLGESLPAAVSRPKITQEIGLPPPQDLLPAVSIPAQPAPAKTVQVPAQTVTAAASVPLPAITPKIEVLPVTPERKMATSAPVVSKASIDSTPKPASKTTTAIATAVETAPATTPAAVSETTAIGSQAALQEFMQSYRAGNMDAFMGQFSADARNNRGGRDAIQEDYARLFLRSKSRDLAFSQAQWQPVPGGMRFKANYRSKVVYQGDVLAERNSGRIEMVFRNDAGQMRIASILVQP